eukprot:136595-Pyramimonas_sp.AAC.1
MKSSADASARIWRSVSKPFLPIAARVPFKSRSRRITSTRAADCAPAYSCGLSLHQPQPASASASASASACLSLSRTSDGAE